MSEIRYLDDADTNTAERMNIPAWMLNVLKLNPSYCNWGNNEDSMTSDSHWGGPCEVDNWSEIWEQDSYNEIVYGYFFITRASKECLSCEGYGLNEASKEIEDAWYDFDNKGVRWENNLTDDEVEELVKQGRVEVAGVRYLFEDGDWKVFDYDKRKWVKTVIEPAIPSAEEFNERGYHHDAINRSICVKKRAERLGVWGDCEVCGGTGSEFTEDECKLKLQLWVIHPRKGAARGLIVNEVRQEDLPEVRKYFKTALKRAHERFDRLAGIREPLYRRAINVVKAQLLKLANKLRKDEDAED